MLYNKNSVAALLAYINIYSKEKAEVHYRFAAAVRTYTSFVILLHKLKLNVHIKVLCVVPNNPRNY